MAELLSELTGRESDALWWRLVRAMAAVSDEVDALTLTPEGIRDGLYGHGCLESYTGLLAELAELADNDVHPDAVSWMARLTDTSEEGSPQWHDSDATPKSPMTVRFALLLRQHARTSFRRLTTPR